jgi:uncharacterized membrane protein YfcA
MIETWLILGIGGLLAGLLAGLLGIGGGTLLVPILVSLNFTPVQSVATSSLAIVITSVSGSVQNFAMGFIKFKPVFYLAIPSLITAQFGVYLTNLVADHTLLIGFSFLLIINIFLTNLKQRLSQKQNQNMRFNPLFSRLLTGGLAGFLAGFFGVGGGVIMVPLQMLLLGDKIKVAIQTSLAVIVITSFSACVGHYLRGNVLFAEGIMLGFGGLIGAQISTRFLPKLPDQIVSLAFNTLLICLAIYFFLQAIYNS